MSASEKRIDSNNNHLRLHYLVLLLIYIFAICLSYGLLSIPAANINFVASLSSAAILATFGSAIATVGSLWTGDRSNRIILNVDILFRDIFKQEAWRRWPFLLRGGQKRLFGGMATAVQLHNPKFPLHVGSHEIEVFIPTVQEDFFDLPLFKNLIPLLRFRTAAHTTIVNADKDMVFPSNQMKPMDQYMAYECITDIWVSVFIFRSARYVVHFGAALTISSVIIGVIAAGAYAF